MKRIISFVLILITLIHYNSLILLANEETTIPISVIVNGKREILHVIEYQNDYLVDLDTLAFVSQFSIKKISNSHIDFIKGDKIISIYLDIKKFKVSDFNYFFSLTKIVKKDNKIYLPFSEIIPWLNTNIDLDTKENLLTIKADAYSMFLFSNTIELPTFDFDNECNRIGKNSLEIKIRTFVSENILNGKLWMFLTNYGDIKTYESILSDYINSTTNIGDILNKVDASYSISEGLLNSYNKEDMDTASIFSIIINILTMSEDIYNYSKFMHYPSQNLKGKIEAIECLRKSDKLKRNDPLSTAANMVISHYLDIEEGLIDKVLEGIIDTSFQLYIGSKFSDFSLIDILSNIGSLETLYVVDNYKEEIFKIDYYKKISDIIYENIGMYDLKKGYDALLISEYRNEILLYLYTIKMQYMAILGLSQHLGDSKQTDYYLNMINQINGITELVNLTQDAIINDSIYYYINNKKVGTYKSEYTKHIQKLITNSSKSMPNFSANDFLELTIEQMVEKLGNNYNVANYRYAGASALITYEGLPYVFMPVVFVNMDSDFVGDEIITDIQVYEDGNIINDLSGQITFSEFEKNFPDGKFVLDFERVTILGQAAIQNRILTCVWSGENFFENFVLENNIDVIRLSPKNTQIIVKKYFESYQDETSMYTMLSVKESGLVKSFYDEF